MLKAEHFNYLRDDSKRGIYSNLVVSLVKNEYFVSAAAKKIVAELREWVAKEIGPIAKPDEIRFGDNLPKTRSGKIMRRLLRVLAKGEEITQDVSTLENPAILEQLKQAVV